MAVVKKKRFRLPADAATRRWATAGLRLTSMAKAVAGQLVSDPVGHTVANCGDFSRLFF
jgi:hypothetical protein